MEIPEDEVRNLLQSFAVASRTLSFIVLKMDKDREAREEQLANDKVADLISKGKTS